MIYMVFRLICIYVIWYVILILDVLIFIDFNISNLFMKI